jgi:hypothetical protein
MRLFTVKISRVLTRHREHKEKVRKVKYPQPTQVGCVTIGSFIAKTMVQDSARRPAPGGKR